MKIVGALARAARNLGSLVVYAIGWAVPRRPDLWVFGAWFGGRFSDNCRFVFEHVRGSSPELRAVWLARDDAVVEQVRRAGGEAYRADSLRGLWLTCRAALAVVSSGPDDVNRLGLSRTKCLQLWHGTPLKKIKYDDTIGENERVSRPRALLKAAWRRVFPFEEERYAALIAPSDSIRARMASAFRMPTERVHVTGWPRADVILGAPARIDALDEARRAHPGVRFVLYAPTFRRGTTADDLFRGLDPEQLDAMLAAANAVLLVRLHYVQRASVAATTPLARAKRVLWLGDAEVADINMLLPHVDVLVTDYSSVYFDYLLLDRPIVFTPFDLDSYLRAERGMYDDYARVTPGPKCGSWRQAIEEVGRALAGDDRFGSQRAEVNRRYNSFRDRENSARVAELARRVARGAA